MACGQSFYEDSPRKEQEREERRKRLNLEASEKIMAFFSTHSTVRTVSMSRKAHERDHDCKRILTTTGEQTLTIHHRGYEILVDGDPAVLVPLFEKWHKVNMTHARIFANDH